MASRGYLLISDGDGKAKKLRYFLLSGGICFDYIITLEFFPHLGVISFACIRRFKYCLKALTCGSFR